MVATDMSGSGCEFCQGIIWHLFVEGQHVDWAAIYIRIRVCTQNIAEPSELG